MVLAAYSTALSIWCALTGQVWVVGLNVDMVLASVCTHKPREGSEAGRILLVNFFAERESSTASPTSLSRSRQGCCWYGWLECMCVYYMARSGSGVA